MDKDSLSEWAFEAQTPLGFHVHVTQSYWQLIISIKHPIMKGREAEVSAALTWPAEVRVSRSDPRVYLFYRQESPKRWICAVVKRTNGEGFLVTTYPTDAIKEGERIWPS